MSGVARGALFVTLLACGLLAGCGGMSAPSLGLPGDSIAPPPNAQMGQIVGGDYIVASGDTLATVSARTNTPIRALIDNNALQPPYILKPGQRLQLAQRQAYVVRAGDTLSGLAQRFNVSQSALVDLNDLVPPYVIRIGQTLVLPSTIEAPQQTMAAQQHIEAAPAGEITTAPLGGTSAAPPAAAAGTGGAAAQPGARPFTPTPSASTPTGTTPAASVPAASTGTATGPAGAMPANQASATSAEPDLTAAEEAAERAYEEARKQAAATEVPSPAPAAATPPTPNAVQPAPTAAPQTASATVGPPSKAGFSWPVQGKVIARFGTTADGLRNDGINIAAPAGAPVMAAADGTVAYAGNQLRGFGNLILLRHDNGLITAYAHNQSMLVEKGAKVKRGDVIARVGSTGSVDSPQLHFEIRKGEQAVDPLKYLDGGT